jgi:cyclophilin family peptidyl-prolyl cis-trans isomerase
MGTDKRARQKAGRQARIEAALAAQQKAEARSRMIRGAVFIAIAVVLIGALMFSKRDDNKTVESTAAPTTSSLPGGTVPGTVPGIPPVTVAGSTIAGPTECPPADGSAARATAFEQAPPMCIDTNKTYRALVSTTKGDFTITLDAKTAPKTVNNFVVLSRYHFYDGVSFHRVIPGFVVQGGDPTGTGSGDIGYKFEDELPQDKSLYKLGTVAMANSGPNTNGSQFYIVTGEGRLEAKYSIFGQVTEGFDTTIKAIEAGGSAGGTPSDPAYITSVSIAEG